MRKQMRKQRNRRCFRNNKSTNSTNGRRHKEVRSKINSSHDAREFRRK